MVANKMKRQLLCTWFMCGFGIVENRDSILPPRNLTNRTYKIRSLLTASRMEHQTSVPILCQITLQNAPYMDLNLLVLMNCEVITMDFQQPTCCNMSDLLFLTKKSRSYDLHVPYIRCFCRVPNLTSTNVDAPSHFTDLISSW